MTHSTPSIPALIERVKTVVTDPEGCWDVISADARDAKTLFKVYALPMAVIGSLISPLVALLTGFVPDGGVGTLLLQFVSAVIMTCVSGFIVAFIATKVASWLGGSVTLDRAYSWGLHTSMVSFVGSLAGILPIIGWFIAFAANVAALYWGWKGIGRMVDVPAEKRAVFYIGTIVVTFITVMLLSVLLIGVSLIPGGDTAMP